MNPPSASLKTEHPILFTGPMVRAILNGSKTQTRRWLKLPCDCGEGFEPEMMPPMNPQGWQLTGPSRRWRCQCCLEEFNCPYGQPGHKLWVRERWATHPFWDDVKPSDLRLENTPEKRDPPPKIYFKADDTKFAGFKWRPSIHMPRAACRLTLEITAIRVKRLQDITEDDARAEGCQPHTAAGATYEYERLWESINGTGSWSVNPWVWVIEFKRNTAPQAGRPQS